MPELPEVETIVRDIRPAVMGRMISGMLVRPKAVQHLMNVDAETFYKNIIAHSITTVLRKGKYIIMPLDNSAVLVFHLGMTGRLLSQKVPDVNFEDRFTSNTYIDKHTHLILDLMDPTGDDDDVELQFNDVRLFGKIWLVPQSDNIEDLPVPGLSSLGPDALGITLDEFSSIMRTKRNVKAVLLDQNKVAGVGNIYADEACFASGVHPTRTGASLTKEECGKLWLSVKTVLKEGLKYRGSSTSDYTDASGRTGSFQDYHKVYQKAGQKCVGCGETIERIKLAGRSTHFCPSCQK
ncbi:MAG: bifunctional DNA-formamidopyrimidine glycosylase/DNA-(apurinic or apyrimidinic site) lyase [Candidatus Altiarchaeales archaeon]|nr:bifunctional DNA-formamidopyrimidine glycosylase/DNA-(apurinic or apyrimidinic site) lyase [Candidatus Altiarchaeales archaeon]